MKWRWISAVGLLAVVSVLAFWVGRRTAAFDPSDSFTGQARIEGPLQLDLTVSPPVGTPGDTLVLTVHLHNEAKVTAVPQVSLQLPPGVSPDTAQLPAGLTMNLQTNRLNWLPILPANGGEEQVDPPAEMTAKQPALPSGLVLLPKSTASCPCRRWPWASRCSCWPTSVVPGRSNRPGTWVMAGALT
ncbi:MAG: hypothetical protein P8183_13200 [Anaerolineae bacterium]